MGLFSGKKKKDYVETQYDYPEEKIPESQIVDQTSIPEVINTVGAGENTIPVITGRDDAAVNDTQEQNGTAQTETGKPNEAQMADDAKAYEDRLREDEAMLNFAINQQQEINKEASEAAGKTSAETQGVQPAERPVRQAYNPAFNPGARPQKVFKPDETMQQKQTYEEETKKVSKVIKAVICLTVLAFLFILAFNLGRQSVKIKEPSGVVTLTPSPSVTPKPESFFSINDLENYVRALKEEDTGGFNASVADYYGYQYLCLSKDNLKLYYRNEYPIGYRENSRIVIDNGTYRTEMEFEYDLTNGISGLIPYVGTFGGDSSNQLAFVTYSNGFPDIIRFIDADKLFNYGDLKIEDSIRELYTVSFEEDPSLEAVGKRYQMKFVFSKTAYVYAVSKETFISGEYDSIDVIDFSDGFSLKFEEDGISFDASVKTCENEYLGRVNGSLAKSNLSFKVSGVRYGSFAVPSQAGYGEDDIINPQEAPFPNYVTIIAKNGQRFYLSINDEITPISISWSNMVVNDDGTYEYVVDGEVRSIKGIDVSYFQGDIDWDKVAAAGIKFVMIRLGYRGYGEGTLEVDKKFEQNITGALAAGIKVGIYFFSEAITPEEAVEEADFVLDLIMDYDVQYPVVFDTEDITTANARANNLTFAQRTQIARAFCDRITEGGFRPMIYANSRFMLTAIDLEQLNDIDRWFAYYGTTSQFPYSFNIFQYSETGKVDGIPSAVDLDISFVDYTREPAEDKRPDRKPGTETD